MRPNIPSIARIFHDKRKEYDGLSDLTKDDIDSFLSFASFASKDESYYPYWAKIDFQNHSSFISEYVYRDYNSSPGHGDRLYWQVSESILDNRNLVWNFFMEFPTFERKSNLYNTKRLLLQPTFRHVIEVACHAPKPFYTPEKNILRLAACNEFFQYADKLWDDLSRRLPNDQILCSTSALKFAEQFRLGGSSKKELFRKLKNILEPYT